jgi:hypothetical protein
MKTCPKCRKSLYDSERFCSKCGTRVDERRSSDDEDSLLSGVVGYASDSAILGTLIGGSITGAVIGDMLDGDLFD